VFPILAASFTSVQQRPNPLEDTYGQSRREEIPGRKFPSWIGNIFKASLHEIYESSHAKRYRAGSSACAGCFLRPVCGGCQAVVSSMGLDPARDLDPHCFFPQDCEQVEAPELCAG